MSKFTGNIIRLPAVTPTQNSASGVYTLDDQFTAQSSGTWPIVRDQYFNYTTLLLTGAVQGTAYPNPVTQPYSFLSDASTNNFVVSPNGDVSARPFNPYTNSYGNYFGGDGNYLSAAYSTDWAFAGDFSIEAWINVQDAGRSLDATKTGTIIGQGASGSTTDFWSFYFIISGGVITNVTFELGSSTLLTVSSQSISLNTWHHFVVCRSGSTLSIFVDGTRIGVNASYSTAIAANTSGTLQLARNPYGSPYQNWTRGYFSNVRILNGSSAYTATQTSITVPTAPLTAITNTKLLTCQANRFIDTNTQVAVKTITVTGSPAVSQNSPFVSYDTTNGSGYFDGTGDYLSIASTSTALPTGTQDYSVEAWFYWGTQVTSYPQIVSNPTTNGFQVYYDVSGGVLAVGVYNVRNVITYTIAQSALANQWTHIVVTRSGNTHRMFVNGVLRANGVDSISFASLTTQTIGSSGAANYFVGYMSDVRSVLSSIPTAYQTSSTTNGTTVFTPPTSLLPVVSGTSLLTLQTRAPATNNGFIDSSPNNFVVTRNGNTTQGSFSPFSPTGWSVYGSGSSYLIGPTSNEAMNLGTGAYTLEGWIYLTSYAGAVYQSVIFCAGNANGAIAIGILPSGALDLSKYGTGSVVTSSANDVLLNTWYHVAAVRTSTATNDTRLYVNGVLKATGTDNNNWNVYTTPTVGALAIANFNVSGYLSNVRVVKGVAVYTGAFTPPASPLSSAQSAGPTGSNIAAITGSQTSLLTCQSNRFRDASSYNFTITTSGSPSVQAFSPFAPAQSYIPSQIGGSGYFDGSDYLSAPDNDAWHFGTGDFTIEAWYYPTTTNSQQIIVAQSTAAGGGTGLSWQLMTSNDSNVYLRALVSSDGSGWVFDLISTSKLQINAWNHVAFVRSGTAFQLYLNGAAATNGSATSSAALYNTTTPLTVGASNAPNQYVTGYMAGVRIVKGTAVYSGTTYTVPTAPPTAIPNTSLLLNFTNGGIVDATGKNNLETVANSGVQTSQAKWSPGSIYLSGDGNYLTSRGSPVFSLNGDFTMEAWVYPINAGRSADAEKYGTIASCSALGVNSPEFSWFIRIVGSVITEYFLNMNGTTVLQVTGLSVSLNAWHYFAVTRSGTGTGNVKLYIDGGLVGTSSVASTQSPTFSSTQTLMVGRNANSSAYQNWLSGYFQGLRITPGYVRNVTSSPTGPFPLG